MKRIFSILTIFLFLYATFAYAQGDITPLGISKLDGSTDINRLLLPQINEPTTPTLTFGDGDSGFYEYSDDTIVMAIAGAAKWEFTNSFLRASDQAKPGFARSDPTATGPNILPATIDTDTGIGSAGVDILSLIAGGVEGIRITEVAGANTINLMGKIVMASSAITCAANVCTDVPASSFLIITTDATVGADVLTIANGVTGEIRTITLKTDGTTDLEITPTNFANGTKITLDTAGESAMIQFDGTKWFVIATYGGVIS